MSVTEDRRHELHEWAKGSGGREVAATLMELLPPVGWAGVATKTDIAAAKSELRAEIAALGTELRAEIAGVRSEVAQQGDAVRAEMHRELRVQLYWLLGFMFTMQSAFAAFIKLT